MICEYCNAEVIVGHHFCGYCGKKQETRNNIKLNSQGDNNINIGVNNGTVENKHTHYQFSPVVEDVPKLQKKYKKKLTIAGNDIKNKWLVIVSSICTVADFIYIINDLINSFKSKTMFPITTMYILLFIFAVSLITLAISLELKKKGFFRLLFGYSLQTNSNGYVYVTKIIGVCPKSKCKGKLKLFPGEDTRETYIVCSRNPKHRWEFDYTDLDDSDLK